MRQVMLAVIIGLLLIGVNVFAQGDLQVGGKIGVGKTPVAALNIEQDDVQAILVTSDYTTRVSPVQMNITSTSDRVTGVNSQVNLSTTSVSAGRLTGASYNAQLNGDGVVNFFYGMKNALIVDSSTGSGYSSIGNIDTPVTGNDVKLLRGGSNTKDNTIPYYYGFRSWFQNATGSSGNFNGTLWTHFLANSFDAAAMGTVAEVNGLRIDKQVGGNKNYGIVLDGELDGADIAFGEYNGSRPRIFAQNGQLYARDWQGNVTLNSPHDPVTNEWIYYSKNTKTGVVKRVNMEKLVKAVEKLTGETFMVETLEEIK